MPSTTISFSESDVVRLILEFLANRELRISMLSLERETGVINGVFSDDLLFLRQLILDGHWDDAIDFVQPLGSVDGFDMVRFRYAVCRHKYLELLCVRADAAPGCDAGAVDEVVRCLNELEPVCPSRDDYNRLCLLLTTSRLSDHPEYAGWNPSSARVQCFMEVQPLVEPFLPAERSPTCSVAHGDRMIQLLVKGLLYESCVDFCQREATGSDSPRQIPALLTGAGLEDADVSLLSWLEAVPHDAFACPFEQRSLRVNVQPIVRPHLEASWSEQILASPIRPTTFPHSATPVARPRSVDQMSRSLNPQYDGLARGLSGIRGSGFSDSDRAVTTRELMSRSFAGFHLNVGARLMNASVDKLFEHGEEPGTRPALSAPTLASVQEESTFSPEGHTPVSPPSDQTSTGLSTQPQVSPAAEVRHSGLDGGARVTDSSTELYREYQKQRQRVQEQLIEQEKQRLIYKQQLLQPDNRIADELDSRIENKIPEKGTVCYLVLDSLFIVMWHIIIKVLYACIVWLGYSLTVYGLCALMGLSHYREFMSSKTLKSLLIRTEKFHNSFIPYCLFESL